MELLLLSLKIFFLRTLFIRIAGKNKRGALTIIRKEISEIHQNYEKLEFDENIPCGCTLSEADEKPFFIKANVLLRYKDNKEKYIKCEGLSGRLIGAESFGSFCW
jgi:internalin A